MISIFHSHMKHSCLLIGYQNSLVLFGTIDTDLLEGLSLRRESHDTGSRWLGEMSLPLNSEGHLLVVLIAFPYHHTRGATTQLLKKQIYLSGCDMNGVA